MCSIQYETSSQPAYIASFTNGELKNEDSAVNFKLYGRKDGNYAQKRILVARSDKLDYVGQTFGNNATKCSMFCKYYIGVLNKRTGKMRVKDASFIRLNPKSMGDDNAEGDDTADMSFQEKNDMLISAFGSKGKQRALSSRMKFSVKSDDIESVVSKTLDETIITPGDANKIGKSQASSKLIPPINADATQEDQVYDLNDLVSKEELNAIPEDDVKMLTTAKLSDLKQWLEDQTFSSFVVQQIPDLPKNPTARLNKGRLLVYTEYLFMLMKLPPAAMRRRDPLPESIPLAIRKKLLSKFTETVDEQRNMSSEMKDKLAIHIILFALFIGEFSIKLDRLQPALKMKRDKLQNFMRALRLREQGATDSKERLAILRLPLPVVSAVRTHRRR